MQEITLLLNSRPQSPATDPKGLLYAFSVAIKGIDPAAVVKTAQRYMRGEVEGDTLRFAPSSAEFAKEARRQQHKDEYDRRPKIQDKRDDEPQHSDEHRAMMLKRLSQLSSTLGTKSDAA